MIIENFCITKESCENSNLAHSSPLFKEQKILEAADNIVLLNCLFVHDYFHNNLPSSFNNTFIKSNDMNSFFTRSFADGMLARASFNTTTYGIKSIYNQCVESWNDMTRSFKVATANTSIEGKQTIDLHNVTRNNLKQIITDFFINSYS